MHHLMRVKTSFLCVSMPFPLLPCPLVSVADSSPGSTLKKEAKAQGRKHRAPSTEDRRQKHFAKDTNRREAKQPDIKRHKDTKRREKRYPNSEGAGTISQTSKGQSTEATRTEGRDESKEHRNGDEARGEHLSLGCFL